MIRIPSSYTAAALATKGFRPVDTEPQRRGNGLDYIFEHTTDLAGALENITDDRQLQRLFHEHRQLKRAAQRQRV
jgi:hypothetical protein